MKTKNLTINGVLILVTLFMMVSVHVFSTEEICQGTNEMADPCALSENPILLSEEGLRITSAGSTAAYHHTLDPIAGLSFSTPSTLKPPCPGGPVSIVISATGGTPPYEYYVIPESQWMAGDQMYSMLYNNNFSRLYRYTYTGNTIAVEKGTPTTPRNYWVAVQDKAENGVISGTYMLSWWKKVSVYEQSEIVLVNSALSKSLTTCYQQNNGRISFTVSGGTPWKNGYNIVRDRSVSTRGISYDSGFKLGPGTYRFTVSDSLNCIKDFEYVIKQPKKISFSVGHSEAGCGSGTNELWISSVDASSGSGSINTWRWHYSQDTAFASVSSWYSMTTKATGVPAGRWYVEVEDGNGCHQKWIDIAGLIPIPFGQDIFKPAWKGAGIDVMNIYVISAKKDGEDLERCDEIAVYDGKICVGEVKLSQIINPNTSSTFGLIKASRAQTGQSNGYVATHQMSFRMWDRSKLREVSVSKIEFINPTSGRVISAVPFTPNGTAYVRLTRTNSAPVAHAGPDQTVSEGDLVTLNGTASSDPQGDPLAYNWIAPASISLSSNQIAKPTFLAPKVKNDSTVLISLRVSDGSLNCLKPDTVLIYVKNLVPTWSEAIYARGDINSPYFTPPKGEMKVKIYPNPTSGIFMLTSDELSLLGSKMEVFNSTGQLLQTRYIDKDPFEISVTGHASGWYFIKVTGISYTSTGKVYLW